MESDQVGERKDTTGFQIFTASSIIVVLGHAFQPSKRKNKKIKK